MKTTLMGKGARTLVEICAGVKPNEQVLIVTEPKMLTIAESVATAVNATGAEPIITIMTPRYSDGQEPPLSIATAMKESDVFISAVYTSITHTKAVKEAIDAGGRGIMLTQFNEEMLMEGGVHADFKALAPKCKEVAKAMEGAKEISLTTPFGTDLTLSAVGRPGNFLTCMVSKGEFAPVPTIEANVSPNEGTAQGVIVADASIPYIGIGLLEEPVVAQVENGNIISIEGGFQAKKLKDNLASKKDPFVYNIAEIGIGLNPQCKFIGSMLEDEGVAGAVHIGIGTNITLGGEVKAACHYDLIMTQATVVADGKTILKDGEVYL